jgi:hypothetical protein
MVDHPFKQLGYNETNTLLLAEKGLDISGHDSMKNQ